MTTPAPSRRRFGVLLIWCGTVAMVFAGAFTVAWVKLPEWQPKWVIEHSPWADPAVRAMIHYGAIDYRYPRDHVMEWSAAIGPALRRQYETGSPHVREQVLVLAVATLSSYHVGGFSLFREETREVSPNKQPAQFFRSRLDGRRFTISEEEALRADLTWLAVTASKEASEALRARSLPLILVSREPDLRQVPCDWFLSGTSGIDPYQLFEAIEEIRDPRSVPRLIPLLSTTPESSTRARLAYALRQCLASSQVAEVVGAARHQDRYVREWAASVINQVRADPVLEECLFGLLSDAEADVRMMALDTVIERDLPVAFHAPVIVLLKERTHEIRRMALDAIIAQGVPATLRAAFLECLTDPAIDLRMMVIDAIGTLRIHEGGDLLLVRLTGETELSLRISMIEALGHLGKAEIKPVLRQIAQRSQDQMQGAAIVALGTLRDPTDFPLLLSLLTNDDDDIARKARIALGYLPLTPEQQQQVDVLWEGQNP